MCCPEIDMTTPIHDQRVAADTIDAISEVLATQTPQSLSSQFPSREQGFDTVQRLNNFKEPCNNCNFLQA